jgi:hypothetical protein
MLNKICLTMLNKIKEKRMKKYLLVGIVFLLLNGCLHLFGPYYYNHDATVTLKDGIPCFLFDTESIRNEQVSVYLAEMWESGHDERVWSQSWGNEWKTLKQNECLPYNSNVELKLNTFYRAGFSVRLEESKKMEHHGYDAFFCLTQNKNGQTVIQQWKREEAPAACPMP